MTTDYKVTELFCIIDEFCKHFDSENAGNLLEDNSTTRENWAKNEYSLDGQRSLLRWHLKPASLPNEAYFIFLGDFLL